MNQFVLGDIHGAYRALLQCLDRANFDYNNDRLIFMGDVYDGWSEAMQAVDELLKIKNLVYLLGNHDDFTLQWALSGKISEDWLYQGGLSTIKSYSGHIPEKHRDYLINAKLYFIENNKLFVHAGFKPGIDLTKQSKDILIWDRSLISEAYKTSQINNNVKFSDFDEVFVGHTPTIRFGIDVPFQCGEIWLTDTGAGWNGKLTIMNIDTKEFFQSDNVNILYPNEPGRY